jgi:hypothetical protein
MGIVIEVKDEKPINEFDLRKVQVWEEKIYVFQDRVFEVDEMFYRGNNLYRSSEEH